MAVYVDNMRAPFGRMVMCHLVADSLDELHAMADKIGVARRWYQGPPKTRWPHYDIALTKRAAAVAAGAIEIEMRSAPAVARRCLVSMAGESASAA
ncbi:DUF4031 domain-containing protein [Hydrogenophaga sp. NH-16]|uniref:DUF4031 domain-containing protein n=1 Tax=Hydrogenophaga sp. NH-16 TaxID=2184519 RepID=UPI000FD83231|nr:DUF4031 domain-containing protein [Hydrogenophaga sp. NH-16]